MHQEGLMTTDPSKYYEVVDQTVGTGLTRPERPLGFVEVELALLLSAPPLGSYLEWPGPRTVSYTHLTLPTICSV